MLGVSVYVSETTKLRPSSGHQFAGGRGGLSSLRVIYTQYQASVVDVTHSVVDVTTRKLPCIMRNFSLFIVVCD